jgi:hypothetical protein
MNTYKARPTIKQAIATLERNRQLSEYVRNVDRLIKYNNKRISRGMRALPFPSPMIKAGRALIAGA